MFSAAACDIASGVAAWRRNKAVPTVSEMTLCFLDEDWRPVCPFIQQIFLSRERHFKKRLRTRHSSLAGWHIVEIFSITQVDQRGLNLVLPD